jgi:hypothetical protein
MIKRNSFVSKYINFLTNSITAEAHLAERQFLLEEQTLNIENSVVYRARSRRPTVSRQEGQNLEPR